MISKKTILIILALMIAVIPSVSAATFFDWLVDEPSVIEDPLLCTAIDMWGCEIPPEDAIFGELYTHNIFTAKIPTTSTWHNLTGINQTGNFSVLEQGSPDVWAIEITRNGTYIVDYSVSMQAPGGASDYDFGVSINGAVPENKTHSHRSSTAGGAWGVLSSSSLINLIEGDKITVQTSDTDAPARDLEVQNANFNAHELQTFQTTQLQTIIINQTIGGTVTDIWVNETGDVMSGDLNISFGSNRINLSTSGNIDLTGDLDVGNKMAIGNDAVLSATVVFNMVQNILSDTSFDGISVTLRQTVNNSAGKVVFPLKFEFICDSGLKCAGFSEGIRGNVRNKGQMSFARPVRPTVFNEFPDSDIGNTVAIFPSAIGRFNNVRGQWDTLDMFRALVQPGNGTMHNVTIYAFDGGNIIKRPSTRGNVINLTVFRSSGLTSDAINNSWTFNFSDSTETSLILGNFSAAQWMFSTYINNTMEAYFQQGIRTAANNFIWRPQGATGSGATHSLFFNDSTNDLEYRTSGGTQLIFDAFESDLNITGWIRTRGMSWFPNAVCGNIWFKSEEPLTRLMYCEDDDVLRWQGNGVDVMYLYANGSLFTAQDMLPNHAIGIAADVIGLGKGDLNMSGSLYLGNNLTVATGDVVIWPNGTVETGPASVADIWVDETGDTMTDNLTMDGRNTRIKGGIAFVETFIDVQAGAQDVIVSTDAWPSVTVSPAGQPDVPRVINLTFTPAPFETMTGVISINGTDAYGLYIWEYVIVNCADQFGCIHQTNHAFANITVIVVESAAGDGLWDVGTSDRLGIANYPLNADIDIYKVTKNSVHIDHPYTVQPLFGTIDLGLITNGDDFMLWYRWGVNT